MVRGGMGGNNLPPPRTLSREEIMSKVKEQGEETLAMMAFDVFPRFLKSRQCAAMLRKMSKAGESRQLEGILTESAAFLPEDADDWLKTFVASADSFPACIVISDMTLPDTPMVFINKEFENVTGYSKEEAVGRNCRFLQGPDTEEESLLALRKSLRDGELVHVKITNYRKNGEMFQNLLSMKPVRDATGLFRYCIGVQFEVRPDDDLSDKLMQLDKLLRLLPSVLDVASSEEVQKRVQNKSYDDMMECSKTSSTRVDLVDEDLTKDVDINQQGVSSNISAADKSKAMAKFTKELWMENAQESLRTMLKSKNGQVYFGKFLKTEYGDTQLKFWEQVAKLDITERPDQFTSVYYRSTLIVIRLFGFVVQILIWGNVIRIR